MMLDLTQHTKKKLKAKEIQQDLPKEFKLSWSQSLRSYVTDYFIAVFLSSLIKISMTLMVFDFVPGMSSKFGMLAIVNGPGFTAMSLTPLFFAYTFFSLYMDGRTYGMRQIKTTFDHPRYSLKASFYWSCARLFNLSTFGLISSFINAWAHNRTQSQMTGEDYLYQDLILDKSPVCLVKMAQLHDQSAHYEEYIDERIAA